MLPVGAMPLQQIERKIELPAPGMNRKGMEQRGYRVDNPRMPRERSNFHSLPLIENLRAKRDEIRGG